MENFRVTQARNGDLVVFAINGVLFATWMSRIPDVKAALALTPGQLGVLLLALSVGALIGLPTAGRIAHRIGAAATVRLGLLLTVPGALLAALAVQFGTSPVWVSPGLFLFGLGNGIWDVAQNLEGTRIELGLKKAIMPWFHAAFSGGTVAAALLMVSRIRYNSFKGSGSGPKSDRVPFFALLIVVVVLIALAIDAPKTLLTATLLYALSGPVLWFRRRKLPVQGAAE